MLQGIKTFSHIFIIDPHMSKSTQLVVYFKNFSPNLLEKINLFKDLIS